MYSALKQAENYAQAMARTHSWVPFILVVDVGHEIHVYADFSGEHLGYRPFPSVSENRISFEDLTNDKIQDLFRTIWTDPWSLDPSTKRLQVTKEIAEKLALLSISLERSGHSPKSVSEFLMRTVFTMFAEDVGLLPKDCFLEFLESLREKIDEFPRMLENLWSSMDKGDFSPIIRTQLLKFNGGLFKNANALHLSSNQLEALIEASRAEWKDVEPAIFGTILERAIDANTRHNLGVQDFT